MERKKNAAKLSVFRNGQGRGVAVWAEPVVFNTIILVYLFLKKNSTKSCQK